MISKLSNSAFLKFFWGFLGLYLFNISVDAADQNPQFIPEDLSINDQESVLEILVEKVFGFENAFVEYDDADTEEKSKKSVAKIQLIHQMTQKTDVEQICFFEVKSVLFTGFDSQLISAFHQLDTPPPQI